MDYDGELSTGMPLPENCILESDFRPYLVLRPWALTVWCQNLTSSSCVFNWTLIWQNWNKQFVIYCIHKHIS